MAETVRIEIPIETIDDTEPELSNLVKKLGKAGKEADKFGDSADRARQRVSKFDQAQEKAQKSLSRWMKEKYEIYLEAKERITPVLQALGGRLKSIAGKTWRISMRAVDMVTAPVRGILNLLKNPIFQAGAVLGVSIGLKDTVDTYKDFEAVMSKVQAVSGATGAEMVKLNAKAEEMGAATKFTATQSAEAFNYMAMAGWKTKDMLEGIEGIMNLSAASGEDLATTSDIVTDALTAFGLKAKDSGHFADVLAQASSNANTNVGMMGESFKYVAPVAGAMKYSVEDVSLALGLMANASVKSTMAGTSLRTALANMAHPTDAMATAMDKYGISLTDKQGKMKSLKGVLDNLRGSLGKLSEAEQLAAAGTIFGKEAMSGMLTIVNASERDYNKLTKAVNNADGASADMAETMMDNLNGSITLFQSAFDNVKRSVGKRMAPFVRDIADWLTDAMPDVQEALGRLMDKIERKFDSMKEKFQKISLTGNWQSADFFGKGKILWDEFITKPFAEWWNSTGKAKIADALGNFGEMLGTGLHVGIMTLLGFDVSDTLDEGASIGKQFAKGFSDGFDFGEISKKLWEGLGNMVKNAGKLLPGGQEADLSSLLSAAMLAKIAKPFFGLGSGTVKAGKAVFGGQEALGGISLFSKMMGSTGNAMVGGSGLLGGMADAGYALTGGAATSTLSGGTAALVGGASIAGGVIGAAGLVHGGMDLYEGFTTDDEERAAVYKKAGAVEVGGTLAGAGAGAAIGAGIGAVFGGAGAVPGALIGAGVGAIGSWIAGNKIKDDYEDDLEERQKALANQQKAYDVLGRDIDDVKFKTKALNDALHDSETSTEQFAAMYQEAVADNLKSHFGDVSMSLEEIKKTADSVIFGGQKKQFEEYAKAAENTASSLDALDSSMTELNKQNWRAGLGTKMDDEEIANYQASMENFASNAQKYLANSHYEATLSVELLLGKKGSKDLAKGFDKTYTGMEESLDKLSKRLSKKVEKALEDGVINSKEQKAITKLQKKITGITDKISSARERASRDALKTKYSKGNLDAESFDSLQQELAADSQQKAQNYYDAMQEGYAALELRKGKISKKKYRRERSRIGKAYNKNIDSLAGDTVDFQLDFVAEKYGKELDGILPNLKGTTQEKLKHALDDAFVYQPDSTLWQDGDIVKWFGLDKLDGATQGAFSGIIRKIAASVPEDQKKTIEERFKDTIPTAKEIMEKLDFTKLSTEDLNNILGIDNDKAQYISSPSSGWSPKDALLKGDEENFDELAKKYANRIHESLKNNMNPEEVQNFVKEYMTGAVSSVDKDAAEAANEAGQKVGDSTISSASQSITSGSDILRNALDQSVATATAAPITPTVQVNPNYEVTAFDRSQLEHASGNQGGGSKGKGSKSNAPSASPAPNPTPAPDQNAAGGFVGNKRLSWLAEEGWGEYVIPTNPSRRGRALELYEQAGRALGVQKHAAGGFVGRDYEYSEIASYAKNFSPLENGEAKNFMAKGEVPGEYSDLMGGNDGEDGQSYSADGGGGQDGRIGSPNITVNVQLNPEFDIKSSGGQDENIVEVIRRHIREMADELGGEIASQMEDAFSNRPMEGA